MMIEPRPATDPELASLLVAQQRELRETDGGLDGQVYPLHDDIHFLVGVIDGRVVACGAIQELDGDTTEIKRMYVQPAFRGRGLARQVLTALEELARQHGYTVLRLETGSYLPAAIRLYVSAGYAEIPVYGEYVDNPYSRCYEKRLPVPAPELG
ncbi:GNAT family N-acetyltransferase [Plantactinospora sp. GCM10030261]|uniref:GNAT family N-acetyltransferase n=1 Tax=Plantactinospora sp. GCM10030261 TaxID=3273420 RepID=UPI0036241FB6